MYNRNNKKIGESYKNSFSVYNSSLDEMYFFFGDSYGGYDWNQLPNDHITEERNAMITVVPFMKNGWSRTVR